MCREKLNIAVCSVFIVAVFLFFDKVKAQSYQQSYPGVELSNLHVLSIAQDNYGYMWLATARGLDCLNGYEPIFFLKNNIDNTSISDDSVWKLFISRSGEVFAFARWGLNIYNREGRNFIRVKDPIKDNPYLSIEEDNRGTVWIGTNTGLSYVDRKNNEIHKAIIPYLYGSVDDICRDDKGFLWLLQSDTNNIIIINSNTRRIIAKLHISDAQRLFRGPHFNSLYCVTSKNVFLINSVTKRISSLPVSFNGKNIEKVDVAANRSLYVLTSDMLLHVYDKKAGNFMTKKINGINSVYNITCLFVDRQSNIWIGTFEEGYKFISDKCDNFNIDMPLSNHFKNKFVTFLTGDRNNKIWIATRHDGLQEFDRKTGRVKMLLNIRLKNEESAIACCYYDSQKRLWVATVGGVYCYQTIHGTSLIAYYDNIKKVRYFTEDRLGNLWIISNGNGGIWMLPKQSKKIVNPFVKLPETSSIMYFMQLRSGLYLFSFFGDNVYIADNQGHYRPFFRDVDSAFLKSVTYIYEDSNNILWLGTYGCGLMRYDRKHHQKKIYTMQDGLPSNDVLAITEDKNKTIWLSTSYGLSSIIKGHVFINYFTKDGLLGNQYHERSVYMEHGIIYFTGNHGITSFCPEKICTTHENVPLIIESLVTDKHTYVPYVHAESKIKLNYKEDSFTISFLGFDYASAHNLQYSYILEGYDQHWSMPSTSRVAKFTNIPSGKYILKVKVCNKEGQWNNKFAKIEIVIPPAPWFTWWAIILYFLVVSGFVYWLLRLYINYKVDREKFKMSEETLQKERDLNQTKINFFENISHELRTPIGLIYGPFCELSKEKDFSLNAKKYMSLMGANIERLMSLIEQILNFSHLSNETLSLSVNNVEIIGVIHKIMKRFQGENEMKHIKMTFSSSITSLEMLVDQDKVDKILSNLLSNAYKYTPTGGEIGLFLNILTSKEVCDEYKQAQTIASKYLQISVKDSGIGVPADELDKIFDRFYRSKANKNISIVGSGIGLYYIRCLVRNHKGFIKAALNDGNGMTFMFCLPLDAIYSISEMHKNENNISMVDNEKTNKIIITDAICQNDSIPNNSKNNYSAKTPQLLIIEDEPNLQEFLYDLLSEQYKIERAYDGKEGLEKALEFIPDIILADVMMPFMNGYELCERLKSDIRSCHIPIILLTAKTNIEEQIVGINAGADVYISKPFNPDYLISVLRGTILNRQRIQHIITGVESDSIKEGQAKVKPHLNKMDEELLQKLDMQIEAELENADFSIDALSFELNFSRSTFYRKIKSLTGLSPNDYIRVYKIKRAAEFIKSDNYSLSEIGDMTGFSTQSYFSAIFKKYFGMTPTEYKNSKL